MRSIRTEIEIDASADEVWRHLTDFGSYSEWNPFIVEAEGEAVEGETLEIRVHPPDSREITFEPEVVVADPGRELRWFGRLFLPKLFDGEHSFVIEPLDEGVRFVHEETYSGLLVPVVLDEENVTRGFEEMNEALKRRCEN